MKSRILLALCLICLLLTMLPFSALAESAAAADTSAAVPTPPKMPTVVQPENSAPAAENNSIGPIIGVSIGAVMVVAVIVIVLLNKRK